MDNSRSTPIFNNFSSGFSIPICKSSVSTQAIQGNTSRVPGRTEKRHVIGRHETCKHQEDSQVQYHTSFIEQKVSCSLALKWCKAFQGKLTSAHQTTRERPNISCAKYWMAARLKDSTKRKCQVLLASTTRLQPDSKNYVLKIAFGAGWIDFRSPFNTFNMNQLIHSHYIHLVMDDVDFRPPFNTCTRNQPISGVNTFLQCRMMLT